jgi:hypothetical protein
VTMVVPKSILIQIRLEILRGYSMISARNPTFGQSPKAFDGVCMYPAIDIDFLSMIDRFMAHSEPVNRVIDRIFVCIDNGFLGYISGDKRHDCRPSDISDNLSDNSALPLGDTDNGGFVFSTTPTLAMSLATKVRFVNFHLIAEYVGAFIKKLADLLEYSPCCFIGNFVPSPKGSSRIASPSSGYLMNSIKPYLKGCSRLVKYCACKWRNMVSTSVTGIDISALIPVMLRDFFAYWTLNAVRIALAYKPFNAGIVIRERFLKVFGCELSFSHRNHPLFSYIITQKVLHVKG